MATSPPFFVLGTPRSRTAWLAAFLSAPGRPCIHEPSVHMQALDDLLAMLRAPGAAISDSGLTVRWRDIARECRDARIVVVRRPLGEVFESVERIGLAGPRTIPMLRRLDREIEMMLGRLPVLSVPYHRLADQAACEAVYEFCHGWAAPDGHWAEWAPRNIQADVAATVRAVKANAEGMRRLFPALVV